MQVVVPLAGPDFELADGSTKADRPVGGQPLLRAAIEGRSWWRRGVTRSRDLHFVLRDTPGSRAFAAERLAAWYPDAHQLFLGSPTRGAALSALAGVALCDPAVSLCVDLADILYVDDIDAPATFAGSIECGGIVPVFRSVDPIYSYLEVGPSGMAIRAAEKQVISEFASAGTYFFRDAATYLDAVAHALRHSAEVTRHGLFFVCPLFNGVIASGKSVEVVPVTDVRDLKLEKADVDSGAGAGVRSDAADRMKALERGNRKPRQALHGPPT